MAMPDITHGDYKSMPPSVLIINDGDSLLRAGAELRDHGFAVLEENDSGHSARRVLEQTPQVIMVGEDMPPVGGVSLVEVLREVTSSPIVVVGEGGHTSPAQALLNGADMYISRPVGLREMLARVRALLRRAGYSDNGMACAKAYIPTDAGDLEPLMETLTHTEAKLFRYLLNRAEHLVTREELLSRIWGEAGKDTSLRFYIWQLRRKLSAYSNAACTVDVLNFNGMGYLLKVTPQESKTNGERAKTP
jgi:two-component system KDP operon response regulator KdpE